MKVEATGKVMKEIQRRENRQKERDKKARKRDVGETKALGTREKGGGMLK